MDNRTNAQRAADAARNTRTNDPNNPNARNDPNYPNARRVDSFASDSNAANDPNTCQFCTPVAAVTGSIAAVEEHMRSVHPMEYTIAGKLNAGTVLNESEKQFKEEYDAKKAADIVRADKLNTTARTDVVGQSRGTPFAQSVARESTNAEGESTARVDRFPNETQAQYDARIAAERAPSNETAAEYDARIAAERSARGY